MTDWIVRSWHILKQYATRPATGWVIALAALGFLISEWRSTDFSGLTEMGGTELALASGAYAGALLVLALTAGGRRVSRFGAGLASQLLKYVPGVVWQGQPALRAGGSQLMGRLGVTVALSAAVATSAARQKLVWLAGLTLLLVVFTVSWRLYGRSTALTSLMGSVGITSFLALSGGFVGVGLDAPFVTSARDVAAAWGLGVWAVPVPAGFGIRELYLTLAGQGEAAVVIAGIHRLITLGVDLVVGLVGIALVEKNRRLLEGVSDEPGKAG